MSRLFKISMRENLPRLPVLPQVRWERFLPRWRRVSVRRDPQPFRFLPSTRYDTVVAAHTHTHTHTRAVLYSQTRSTW